MRQKVQASGILAGGHLHGVLCEGGIDGTSELDLENTDAVMPGGNGLGFLLSVCRADGLLEKR